MHLGVVLGPVESQQAQVQSKRRIVEYLYQALKMVAHCRCCFGVGLYRGLELESLELEPELIC